MSNLSLTHWDLVWQIDFAIEDVTRKRDRLGETNHRLVYESNPGFDMGGIRSRSTKRREQTSNRVIDNAVKYVELDRKVKELIGLRAALIKQCKNIRIYQAVLISGELKIGRTLTKEERKTCEKIVKEARQSVQRWTAEIERFKTRTEYLKQKRARQQAWLEFMDADHCLGDLAHDPT